MKNKKIAICCMSAILMSVLAFTSIRLVASAKSMCIDPIIDKDFDKTVDIMPYSSGISVVQEPTTWTNGSVHLTIDHSFGSNAIIKINDDEIINDNTFEISSNGIYNIGIFKLTNKGSLVALGQTSIKINNIDRKPPHVSLDPDHRQYALGGNTDLNVTINTSDNASGEKTIQYAWASRNETPTTWSDYTGVITQTTDGVWYLHYKVVDNAGNITEGRSEAYEIDKTPPVINFTPNSKEWSNADIEMNIKMTEPRNPDGSNPSGYIRDRYRVETNGIWGDWSRWQSLYASRKLLWSDEGVYKVEVESYDNAGNTSEATSGYYKIDKTPPSLTITPSTTNPTHDDILLTVVSSDSLSGVKRIKNPDGVWTNSSKVTYTVTKNGAYEFTVEDNAGNTMSKSITVNNIDKTTNTLIAPTITNFNSVQIKESIQSVYAKISEIIIKDWTVNTNNWRISVSASRLTNKNGHTLPEGSLRLQSPTNIKKVSTDGKAGNLSVVSQSVFNIDTGNSFEVASGNKSRGEFAINFPENALEISIDPSTARIGAYSSTITWELINAP